jgi:prepilin-type processing-associated H-X9-DG protein
MNSRLLLLPLVALAALLATAQTGSSTPEGTVRAFLAAIEKSDMKSAARYVQGAKYEARFDSIGTALRGQGLSFKMGKFAGKEAAGTFSATFDVVIDQGRRKQDLPTQTLKLRKAGNAWKILPGPWPAEPSVSTQIESFATLLAHPEAIPATKTASNNSSCLSALKQVALAVSMFASDNGGKLLLSSATLKAKLSPYVKNATVFHCPTGGVYAFNDALTGRRLDTIRMPSDTVLAYEGANGKLAFRHDGKAAVAFADSHVRLVSPEHAKKLLWK